MFLFGKISNKKLLSCQTARMAQMLAAFWAQKAVLHKIIYQMSDTHKSGLSMSQHF